MPIERIDRRKLERRLANHGINDLLNTFSSSHCHTCLDRIGNGVLLLDNEMRVTYATPQVEQILKKHNPAILLQPKFTLPPSKQADHLSAFANEKKRETDLLNLLLEAKNGIDLLLLICVRLPKPVDMEIYTNHYMITLRDSKYYPSTQWQTFNKQFGLTPTESRLCSALADGLTLNDYCEKWNVAASTARSQLHIVFNKTATHRQSELLRLMLLFTRS